MRTDQTWRREEGAVLVLVALLAAVLVAFAALAVDVGYTYVAKNELQNVADSSALAATRTLGNIYQGLSYEEQQVYVADSADTDAIRAIAQQVASKNRAAGAAMTVRVEDVFIGQWDGDDFTVTNAQPDAVRVIARRDGVLNGPVTTFFAKVFGVDEVPVNTYATAALTGLGTVGPGELELPIGISSWFFENPADPDHCDDDIKFYPTNDPDSCAGFTSWTYGSNDITLRRILEEHPNYENPETIAGETVYNFTGGTLSNPTFDDLLELFQEKGYDVDANGDYLTGPDTDGDGEPDPIHQAAEGVGVPLWETDADGNQVLDAGGNPIRLLYPDGTPRNQHKWMTTVPVYDRDDCSNPNQSIKIVGFADIELRDVLNAPDKLVRGRLKCNYVGPGPERGGGSDFGIKGSIPGLVE